MVSPPKSPLELFARRLASRSVLTKEEVTALLGLRGELRNYGTHTDFVRLGDIVDHSCLVVEGLVGRFGQNQNGDRQISALNIAGDMADLPPVVSPKAGWGIGALAPTTIQPFI